MRTLRVIRKALATTGFMMIFLMCAMVIEEPLNTIRWLGVAIIFLVLSSVLSIEPSAQKKEYEAPRIIERGKYE